MADVRYLITVDDKGTAKVESFGDEIKGLEGKSQDSEKSLKGMFGRIALGAVAIGAAVKGFRDLKRFMGDCIDKAVEQERVEKALNSVIRATGGAAGVTAEAAKSLASELQGVTTFGDEAIISGENLLLTFKNIGADVFPQATETMLDMSEALGQDLKSSAIQLGKALNDPITGVTALQRVGVSFTQSQKDMIKKLQDSGDLMGAQTVILEELKGEFGGAARAARDTFGGAMTALKNTIGDAKEEIGGVITKNEALRGVIADVTDKIRELIEDGTIAEWAANTAIVVVQATKAMAQAIGGLILLWKSIPAIVYDAAAGVATAWGGMTRVYIESMKALSKVIPGLEDDIRAAQMAYSGLEWAAGLFSDEADDQRERVKNLRTEYDDFLSPLDAAIAAFQDYKDRAKDATTETDGLAGSVGGAAGAGKSLSDIFKDLGVTDIPTVWQEVETANKQVDLLLDALVQGKIDGENFAKGIDAIDKKIKALNPNLVILKDGIYELANTALPAARSAVDLLGQDLYENLMPPPGLYSEWKERLETVKGFWDTFTDGLRTKWATEFSAMIEMPSKLREDIAPIFQAIYDTFADVVGQMVSKWVVDFIGKFVSSTKDAVSSVVGTVGDVAKAATNLATGFSPGGMIATAIGTAVGSFLGSFLGPKGAGERDTQLIKDNTWNTNQNVINLHDANVARLDELKLAAWDRNQILRDILTAVQSGGWGGGGSAPGTPGRGGRGGAGTNVVVNPNVNLNVESTPVTIEVDGRTLATVLIPHIERQSTRGRVKFRNTAVVRA